ncbi:hypothetical protein HDU88_008338 [Geranomyces variabilis]|nr:hypothetical protein HDU88_008338 [Geranomyces variabilis]
MRGTAYACIQHRPDKGGSDAFFNAISTGNDIDWEPLRRADVDGAGGRLGDVAAGVARSLEGADEQLGLALAAVDERIARAADGALQTVRAEMAEADQMWAEITAVRDQGARLGTAVETHFEAGAAD